METNPSLELLKTVLGKEITTSPSPFANWLKVKLIEAHKGFVKVKLAVREDMTNPAGSMHGGVIAALMDELMGMAVFTLGRDTFFTTINIQSDFLRAAMKNDVITAEAKVVREGKNIINVECSIFNYAGELLAKGGSNLLRTDINAKNT